MTAPGDATSVGAIVAYLRMNRDQWNRDKAETKRDAREIGALSPEIRISTNAADTIAQLEAVRAAEGGVNREGGSLVATLAAVAPAAIPIGAVAGGAILGLIPTLAAAALGVAGIRSEMKSGALQGTVYANDLATVHNWLDKLKTTAAGGLLSGVHKAVAESRGDIHGFNQDIGVTSHQLGGILAGGVSALLALLHDLAPLFNTIGSELEHGAQAAEHWAHSGDDVSKFVSYVQAELPDVIAFLGELSTTIGHVVQAGAPFGGVLLNDFTLFLHLINALPIGVLQDAVPAAVALYVAFRAYRTVNGIIDGVRGAVTAMTNAVGLSGPKAIAAAAQQKAAAAGVEAAKAQEAAVFERAELAKAEAAATSSRAIAASLTGTESVLASEAEAAAVEAEEFAAAQRAKVVAAESAAAGIAAAAGEAAAASETASIAARTSWTAALGPIGAVAAVVGILGTSMLGSSDDTAQATQAVNDYTQALIESQGAIDGTIRKQTVQALENAHVLELLQQFGLRGRDAVNAVLQGGDAWDRIQSKLDKFKATLSDYDTFRKLQELQGGNPSNDDTASQLAYLEYVLHKVRGEFSAGAAAASRERDALNGTGKEAGTAAQSVKQLTAALDTLAQTELAQAQSEDQFQEAVRGVTEQLKGSHDQLNTTTKAGLANRDSFLSAASAALSLKDAQDKAGGSTAAHTRNLLANIEQLKQAAIAAGADKGQVHELLAQLNLLPSEIRTALKIDTESAKRSIENFVKTPWTTYVQVQTVGTKTGKREAPSGGHTLDDVHRAAGGAITGAGAKGIDSVHADLAPGEWVITDDAVDKLTRAYGPGAMASINEGVLPTAAPASTVLRSAPAAAASGAQGVGPGDVAAAIHGARVVLDVPGVGRLNAHIDTRASRVARAELDAESEYRATLDGMSG